MNLLEDFKKALLNLSFIMIYAIHKIVLVLLN